MQNERLREALEAAGLKTQDVADYLDVDPKTVDRWVTQARVPYPRHRFRLAALLGVGEVELWPEELHRETSQTSRTSELLRLYPHRSDIGADVWTDLIDQAETHIDILADAALFLVEQDPHLPTRLQQRAEAGVRVRLLLGDPDGRAIHARGEEGAISGAVAADVRTMLARLRPLADRPGVASRLHQTTLYNSIYLFDEQMLVNLHVYGLPAAHSPVLHLQRLGFGDLFDTYLMNFERVWTNAIPAWPGVGVA